CRLLRQPNRQERCGTEELDRACARGEGAGARPLWRGRRRYQGRAGQRHASRAEGRGQNGGIPYLSRRTARLRRRLSRELPQGGGRGRLEPDDRLVQEVQCIELKRTEAKSGAALSGAALFGSAIPMPAFICITCGTQFAL